MNGFSIIDVIVLFIVAFVLSLVYWKLDYFMSLSDEENEVKVKEHAKNKY